MKFYVIGIDDNPQPYFHPEIQSLIRSKRIFSGGRRHHEIVRPFLPEPHTWIEITVPLQEVFRCYTTYPEIVVFASGDPLFFGFANTIRRLIPEAEMTVYPTFHSLQQLAHRLQIPYQDMQVVSLTGRPWHKLDEALINGAEQIGILTDPKEHTPAKIASRLLVYGYDNYRMFTGELLGNEAEEKTGLFSLNEAAEQTFSSPNVVILQRTAPHDRPFGIPDDRFQLLNGRTKMITKMPVRLLSLSFLELRNKQVLWDIGFCTGSVSIEAKMQFPHLEIIAFEKREEGATLLAANARALGTPGIQTVIGDFTEIDTGSYPAPDAVFLGGHGGKIKEILAIVSRVLHKQGVIVFNSVSAESRDSFLQETSAIGMTVAQTARLALNEFNAIEIMKATW